MSLLYRLCCSWIPGSLVPFWVDPPVKWHTDDVALLDVVVEMAFHESMGAERIFDVTTETCLSVELDWLEILDVLWVEEHVPYGSPFLVAAQWVASEDNSLEDDLQRVCWESDTRSYNIHVNWL